MKMLVIFAIGKKKPEKIKALIFEALIFGKINAVIILHFDF